MKKIETNLTNLKSKADKLDVDKLIPAPVDLSKLSEVVKNVIKKDVHNANIINIKRKNLLILIQLLMILLMLNK